jgi:para-nitrobenzyl esterase
MHRGHASDSGQRQWDAPIDGGAPCGRSRGEAHSVMPTQCGVIVSAALALGLLPLAAAGAPVKTDKGLVSGVPGRDPEVTVFRGIPYAASPAGAGRWRPPAPVAAWKGIRAADRFGASCIQQIVPERKPWTKEFMTAGDVSEDCLSLNVWTAAKSPADKRPVYVFLHGGAFSEGSGAVPVYDGEGLARKGLVVVTVNYRLGVLGFLAHRELTAESPHHASGNYGLLDQVAALQWVHRNIAAFGGDPTRVTIAGQSAGGMAVHILIASPLARGLFHRAIVESGGSTVAQSGITLRSLRSLTAAEADGARFAEQKRAKSLADLRAMSWAELTAPLPGGGPMAGLRFFPIVDGYLLPAPVDEIVSAGRQNDVPTLTGVNAGELVGFLGPPGPVTPERFKDEAKRYGDLAVEFLRLYPAATAEQATTAQSESSRDLALVSMYLWARERAKTARTPAYLYLWDHALPGPDAVRFGAFHTSEVPYVMDTLDRSDRPFTDADRRIARTLSSYWANFAVTGDPNGPGLPSWPAVGDRAEVMELGDRNAPVLAAGSPEKLGFFETFLMR